MIRVAIVYHSGFGHTKRVAKSVESGAKGVEGVEVTLFTADEATARLDELDECDALVFGAPTYMGGPSAEFKAFADASSQKWMSGAWKDKLAAGFTNAGSLDGDKGATLRYFVTLACQHGMLWVGQGEAPASVSGDTPASELVNRMGSSIGLSTQSDNAPPEETPPTGDLRTAELFGQRVATTAKRWARS